MFIKSYFRWNRYLKFIKSKTEVTAALKKLCQQRPLFWLLQLLNISYWYLVHNNSAKHVHVQNIFWWKTIYFMIANIYAFYKIKDNIRIRDIIVDYFTIILLKFGLNLFRFKFWVEDILYQVSERWKLFCGIRFGLQVNKNIFVGFDVCWILIWILKYILFDYVRNKFYLERNLESCCC